MGWNGSSDSTKDRQVHVPKALDAPRKPVGTKLIVVLSSVFVAAAVAFLSAFYFKSESMPVSTNKGTIRQAKVSKPQNPKSPRDTVKPDVGKTTGEEAPPENVRRYGHSSNVPSLDTNRIHYASDNGLRVVGADGVERKVQSTPIFKNRVDNMMWAAIRPGGMPSGLNALRSRMRFQTGSDEAFLQALRTNEITIEPGDPPHVVTAKNLTSDIKNRIVAEMDAGKSFDELYAEITRETARERAYERIAQEDLRKMIQAGDAEAIRKYVEDMNPVLHEMGLRKLRVPSWAAEEDKASE